MERDFKGVWIPKEIWLDKELSALDKVIFTEIASLDKGEKGCYAGNKYLAEFCQCSESAITKAISKLKSKGLIEVVSFDGRNRRIRIVNFTRQHSKFYEADPENLRPININNNIDNNTNNIDNVKQSSTNQLEMSIETIRETVKTKKKQKENYTEQVKEIIDYLNEVLGTRYSPTSKTTVTDISYILKNGYTVEQCKQVIDRKKQEWFGTNMEQYLRPSTLFRFSKFENYVNQLGRKQFINNKNSIYNNHPDTQTKYYGPRQRPDKEDEMSGMKF